MRIRWAANPTSASTSDGRKWGPCSWMATSTLLNSNSAILRRAWSSGKLAKQSVEHATYTAASVLQIGGAMGGPFLLGGRLYCHSPVEAIAAKWTCKTR